MTNRRTTQNKALGRLLPLFFLLFLSCSGGSIYNEYLTINNITWDKDKEYYFTFRIEDASVPYNVSLEVRNNNLYPYRNLWLFFNEEQPAGPILRDTIECLLADEYGKWKGSGISLYHSSFPIKTRYSFPEAGQYTFSFRQGMRNDALRGIQEIGLQIEKAD